MLKLVSEFEFFLQNEYKEIVFYSNETISKQRNNIINLFKYLYNQSNERLFLLEKIDNNYYKNNFFEVRKNIIIVKTKKYQFVIDNIKNNFDNNKFIPKTNKDFALIHNTHSNNNDNLKETNIFLKRKNIFSSFSEENIDIIIAKENKNYILDNSIDYLFIVENYKIFELNNILEYLNKFEIGEEFLLKEEKIEMLYGSGNKINTFRFNNTFSKNYKKIFYLGDYDEEGYKIFQIFSKKHHNSLFVFPKKDVFLNIQKEMDSEEIVKYREINNIDNIYLKSNLKKILNDKYNLKLDYIYQMQQEVFI